jgi:glycosyltransferase involved in cell wall biosynthesis
MARPTCTIVIPSRDCLNYLPTALATIELQGRSDIEVVVADDGSSDGTAGWLRARRNEGFDLVVLETGGIGPAAARNAAVAASSGRLIAFLDADDTWWPGKLDRQIAWADAHPETGFSFTDYIHVTPDGRTHGTCFEYWRCNWTSRPDGECFMLDDAEAKLLETNVVGTSTVVASRAAFERVGGFDVACRSAEDWDLWLRMAAIAPVACSSAVTMSYLMRPGSETSSRGRRIAAVRSLLSRYEQRSEPRFRQAVRAVEARLSVSEAEQARESNEPLKAARAHLRALALAPSLRTGRALAADVVALARRRASDAMPAA